MSHDNSSKKWHFSASGQSIGKRSSIPETRRPGLLLSINNSRNPTLLKNKKKILKAKHRYDIFHIFYYFQHNFIIQCHFNEIFSESCSAGPCDHFDAKVEFFPCRITKIEFSKTTGCGPSGTCGTSGRIGF